MRQLFLGLNQFTPHLKHRLHRLAVGLANTARPHLTRKATQWVVLQQCYAYTGFRLWLILSKCGDHLCNHLSDPRGFLPFGNYALTELLD